MENKYFFPRMLFKDAASEKEWGNNAKNSIKGRET